MSEASNKSIADTIDRHQSHSFEQERTTRSHSDHASRNRQRRSSQRLILAVALAISIIILLLVSVYATIRISHLSQENSEMHGDVFKLKQELSLVAPELERSRKESAALIKGRLPHLRDLIADKVIAINEPPIKNIVFTVLNQNGNKRFEFKLVVENTKDTILHPEVRIFAFDRHGVQVGMAEISDHNGINPGESRSYSSVIDRFLDEEPIYFFASGRRGAKVNDQ
ncbi:hypothetical protein [Sulfurirhabdus autotrophica]|uniref:Uncharacterized protein n=1 Tax=Sulfurirhabdus autotrophica TaxID=1706046 RepID=A0A4V2W1A0_9PROT|nr:hypothetical protein [Sulfurirhabdus autotrophica]TCV83309.1 hypothetical protein EDC63_11660 [Sulfurirhabdus autotrophica]